MVDEGRDTARDGANADAPGDARMRGEAGARREIERATQVAAAVGCSNAFYYIHELEAQFAEARLGLKSGKRVDRALIRFEQEGETWTVTVKADDFTLNALRPPKIDTRSEEGEDPDAKVLEKMFLIEKCTNFFDALYAQFLAIRLSPGWPGELSDFGEWLREGV